MPDELGRSRLVCRSRGSHNPLVPRRIHVPQVHHGEVPLSEREAHHVRDVLRLRDGERVELFDDAGAVGQGKLIVNGGLVAVKVDSVRGPHAAGCRVVLAGAVPKANRADWLIEKLSELGVDEYIPLAAARSVVVPEGKNKLERWERLAVEAAKQSHRPGVMKIGEVTPFGIALRNALSNGMAWCLSTSPEARPILTQALDAPPTGKLTLFIGPEGDWSPEEIEGFTSVHVPQISLGPIILRVETAAMTAAAVVAARLQHCGSLRQSPPTP